MDTNIKNFTEKIRLKIEHIQSLPEKEKIRIIWIWAIIGTLLAAAGWAIIFRKYEWVPKSGADPALPDMKGGLKDKFGGSFKDLRDKALPELREMIKENKTNTEVNNSINTN